MAPGTFAILRWLASLDLGLGLGVCGLKMAGVPDDLGLGLGVCRLRMAHGPGAERGGNHRSAIWAIASGLGRRVKRVPAQAIKITKGATSPP